MMMATKHKRQKTREAERLPVHPCWTGLKRMNRKQDPALPVWRSQRMYVPAQVQAVHHDLWKNCGLCQSWLQSSSSPRSFGRASRKSAPLYACHLGSIALSLEIHNVSFLKHVPGIHA